MEDCAGSRVCTICKVHVGNLRCVDCTGSGLLCQSCCLTGHKNLPFHHLEKWSGRFFESTSLTVQGFVMHLGHGGDPCNHPDLNFPSASVTSTEEHPGFDNFKSGRTSESPDRIIIIDVLGVHTMMVSWCHCAPQIDKHIQLLRAKLFPTTLKRPSSAFTFQVLDYFHIDSVECKTSAMTFYSKLRRLTDYISPEGVPVCSTNRLINNPHRPPVGSIPRAYESLSSMEKSKGHDAFWTRS
jgi:CxC2 like cysteine cluster associated with KDZ transposases